MAQTKAQALVNLGFPPELARVLDGWLSSMGVAPLTASDITDFDTAAEAAIAAKTEIAALDGDSTAADIVAALKS